MAVDRSIAGLRQVSASVAGSFITLVPVFGVTAGYLVGERLSVQQWVGAIVVTFAVAGVALRQIKADKVRTEPGPLQP